MNSEIPEDIALNYHLNFKANEQFKAIQNAIKHQADEIGFSNYLVGHEEQALANLERTSHSVKECISRLGIRLSLGTDYEPNSDSEISSFFIEKDEKVVEALKLTCAALQSLQSAIKLLESNNPQ